MRAHSFRRPDGKFILLILAGLAPLFACRCDDDVSDSVARLVINPASVDFGDVAIGTAAEARLTLRSDGNVSLRLEGFLLQGATSSAFALIEVPEAGTSLSFGATADLRIAFDPPEEGVFAATLVIESGDPESPARIPITGRGRSPAIQICHAVDDPDTVELDCAEPGEPLILDFGSVPSGQGATLRGLIRNVGDARLVIEEPMLDQAALDGGFQAESFPLARSIPRGGGIEISVSFLAEGQGEASGRVSVRSNDPEHPEAFVDLLAVGLPNALPSACAAAIRTEGIDGRVRESPEPLFEIRARPWDRVYLTAHPFDGCSSDPEDGEYLHYQWRVAEVPEGQGAHFNNERSGPSPVINPQQPQPSIDIFGVGVYRVELVVFDQEGAASPPAHVIIDATPEDDVIVELSWEVGVDLDLHLLAPGSGPAEERVFCDPLDCFWATCRPDDAGIPNLHWGSVGGEIGDDRDPDTDPILRFDNYGDSVQRGTESTRLETISLLRAPVVDPALGPYLIGVGYFDARGRSEEIEATVTLIHAGSILFTSTRAFRADEERVFWIAGSYDSATETGEALQGPLFVSLPYPGVPGACE